MNTLEGASGIALITTGLRGENSIVVVQEPMESRRRNPTGERGAAAVKLNYAA